MRKVQIISRSYCLIWTHIRESFATKLLAGSGRDDSSTILAMGLRNLVLFIETTEGKVFFFFFFFFDGKLFLLGHRAFKIPFSISSSLTTPDDEIKTLFQCKYFFDSFSKFFILSCTNSTYPYFPSTPFFSFLGDILTLHSFPPHPFYEPT